MDVKMFPLKLGSKLQKLVKKFQSTMKYKQIEDRISTKQKISTKRNARDRVGVIVKNKGGPLSSPADLRFVSVPEKIHR